MRRTILPILPAVVCLAACVGCNTVGGGLRFAVANARDSAITEVLVEELNGAVRYRADSIAPHASGNYERSSGGVPVSLKVRWRSGDGARKEQTVKLNRPLPKTFRGRLCLQIEKSGSVRVFVIPDASSESDIPWAAPKDWERSVSIPGLNDQP